MNREPSIQEDNSASEPFTSPGYPETKRKRVMIGYVVGGIVLLAVVASVVVLLGLGGLQPKPTSSDKPVKYPHYNPYIVESVSKKSKRHLKVFIKNNRKELERLTQDYANSYDYTPIVREDEHNYEPERLVVDVLDYDEHFTRIFFDDPAMDRWEPTYYGNASRPQVSASESSYPSNGFFLHENVNNSFQWYFKSNNQERPIIDTHSSRFQYFDKYIEFEASLPTDYIYGMGERIESFHLSNGNYTLWNRFYPYDYGQNYDGEIGQYGSHPFLLARTTDSETQDFVGIFMRNSNAMLFSVYNHVSKGTVINYKMIGGTIDLFIFHSADPQLILQKYHSTLGRPYLPPLWSMGLQQARAGYTVRDFKEIIEKHQENHLPIDALWADTEMNDRGRTFTVNKRSFDGIRRLVDEMHDWNLGIDMHFVAVANPALVKNRDYKYYVDALKGGSLIMSAVKEGSPFEGRTLAGKSVWLDFYVKDAFFVWADGLQDLLYETNFDGIWIYDNEITHDCNGECDPILPGSEPEIPNPHHNKTEFDFIPFRPSIDPLQTDTLHMAAYQRGDEVYHKQYYTHNLYGLQTSKVTYESLRGMFGDKRFFTASRSTWPGSGQYASHWLANNYATWQSMIYSISGMMNFNMFGLPHVGAPIGGYYFNTTDELLVRWFGLGAFNPLMLSHAAAQSNRKEAYAATEYIPEIRNLLHKRYSLIKFMYSKMFEAHSRGGSVVHPLFFGFTKDDELYRREIIDRTFMWSNSLYVIPVLKQKQTTVNAYLPNWSWYDLDTYKQIQSYDPSEKKGRYQKFKQPMGQITTLIKGGSIIPQQEFAEESPVMNVKSLGKLPIKLIVAPDHDNKAKGTVYYDYERYDYSDNLHQDIEMALSDWQIDFSIASGKKLKVYSNQDRFIEKIVILGAKKYQSTKEAEFETISGERYQMKSTYDVEKDLLILEPENATSMDILSIRKIVWKN